MKRFVLFGGWNYYPAGGADDHRGSFDTLEEAKACAKEWVDGMVKDYASKSARSWARPDIWWHIWDQVEDEQVMDGPDWSEEKRPGLERYHPDNQEEWFKRARREAGLEES